VLQAAEVVVKSRSELLAIGPLDGGVADRGDRGEFRKRHDPALALAAVGLAVAIQRAKIYRKSIQ
jgi:hypothetical protein